MNGKDLNWGGFASETLQGIGSAIGSLFGGNTAQKNSTQDGSNSVITGSDNGVPVSVGVNTDTKKMLVIGGVVIVLVALFSTFMRKGGRR